MLRKINPCKNSKKWSFAKITERNLTWIVFKSVCGFLKLALIKSNCMLVWTHSKPFYLWRILSWELLQSTPITTLLAQKIDNGMIAEVVLSEWNAVRLQEYANIDLKEPFFAWWVYIKTPLMFTDTGGYTHQWEIWSVNWGWMYLGWRTISKFDFIIFEYLALRVS